jgi:hypothetical protein
MKHPSTAALSILAFDRSSVRARDGNGFLRVGASNITKETINPYYGREIPGGRDLGLEPEKIYQGYRSGEELRKSVPTWQGLPLLLDHHVDSAEDPQKEARVGSVGTDVAWSAPYLTASLTVWDAGAQREIESGAFRKLSCAYAFEADFTPGEFQGRKYDFVMRDIRGNHVALVREGRAGPDVVVADAGINPKQKEESGMGLLEALKKLIAAAEAGGVGPDPGSPAQGEEPGGETAPEAAEDGDSGEAELYALIDALRDKELAAGIRAKIEEIRAGREAGLPDGEGTDLPVAGGEEVPAAKKAGGGEKEDAVAAMDGRLRRTALDAARKQARSEAQAHFRNLYDAARKVRPLTGEIDALAFDSAGDIYRHALEKSGVRAKTSDLSALSDMVDMAVAATRRDMTAPGPAPRLLEGHFAGLSRIKTQI